MNRVLLIAFVAAAFAAACNGQPVGRKCFIPGVDVTTGGQDGGVIPENILASPALECQSRTCLHLEREGTLINGMKASTDNLCTAECSGDGDCSKVPESPCKNGFVCAVAVETGPFCCKKFCQCKDYLIIPDGGLPPPATCDPNNAINECCNLAGRRDTANAAMYPQCSGSN